jgi:hypothetical protein
VIGTGDGVSTGRTGPHGPGEPPWAAVLAFPVADESAPEPGRFVSENVTLLPDARGVAVTV